VVNNGIRKKKTHELNIVNISYKLHLQFKFSKILNENYGILEIYMRVWKQSYWLYTLGLGLVSLHLILSDHLGRPSFFSHAFFFWSVAFLLLSQKQLKFKSDNASCLTGGAILTLVLYKSLHLFPEDYFLRIAPLLSLLGWGLIASGGKNLKQYSQELIIVAFLAVPWELVYLWDISPLTARLANFILWLMGFDVVRQGVWLILPTGSVEVYTGCSGIKTILQLIGLSWIILTIIKTSWKPKLYLPLAAIFLGFMVNGFRVAVMAILVALSDSAGFEYWHTGTGSLIFSGIAVLLFGVACALTIPKGSFEL